MTNNKSLRRASSCTVVISLLAAIGCGEKPSGEDPFLGADAYSCRECFCIGGAIVSVLHKCREESESQAFYVFIGGELDPGDLESCLAFDTGKKTDRLHIRLKELRSILDVDWRGRSIYYDGERYNLCNGNIFTGALEGRRLVIKQHRGNCPVSEDCCSVLGYFKRMLPEDRDVQDCQMHNVEA